MPEPIRYAFFRRAGNDISYEEMQKRIQTTSTLKIVGTEKVDATRDALLVEGDEAEIKQIQQERPDRSWLIVDQRYAWYGPRPI